MSECEQRPQPAPQAAPAEQPTLEKRGFGRRVCSDPRLQGHGTIFKRIREGLNNPDPKIRRRTRVGIVVGAVGALGLAAAGIEFSHILNSGTVTIDPKHCFTVQVPGPVDSAGKILPGASKVPLDGCFVK